MSKAVRNAQKAAQIQHSIDFRALGIAQTENAARHSVEQPNAGVLDVASLGSDVRDTWVAWLQPVFAGNDSCYFTGTYSDDYGIPHGLMKSRNVHKDFRAWLKGFGFEGRYICGVEEHRYRDVLHLHAILQGPFTPEQMRWMKLDWSCERGYCKALPVLDGCEKYVTKYALKGDTESFEWRL